MGSKIVRHVKLSAIDNTMKMYKLMTIVVYVRNEKALDLTLVNGVKMVKAI